MVLILALTTGQALAAKTTYTLTHSNYAFWKYKVHPNENPNWSQHGTFEGGLGIWYGNWDIWAGHFGLTSLYPSAGDAPPDIQIMVADWAYHNWRDGNGRRPFWGSFNRIGYPN